MGAQGFMALKNKFLQSPFQTKSITSLFFHLLFDIQMCYCKKVHRKKVRYVFHEIYLKTEARINNTITMPGLA